MTPSAEYRCVATILFAELAAADWAEDRDPEALHEALADQARRFGGVLSPTLDDAVMAVFGAPAAQEDHALRGCAAAEAMQAALAAFPGWRVRIGLASGELLWSAANHRSGRRAAAVGEPVHAAAKLQQAAEAGTVCLADSTVRLAAPWLASLPVAPITLAPGVVIPAHRLVALRAQALAEEATGFVGRQRPMRALDAALAGVGATWVGQARLVVGDAGIGKSRLLREFLARHPGLPVLHWPQLSVRPAGAREPLAQVAADLLGGEALAGRAALTARLAGERLRPHLATALVDSLYPQTPDPGGRMRQACRALADLAATRAAGAPLLLVVEDLHWAGAEMLQLVLCLAERCADAPLLLLTTARGVPELPGLPNALGNALRPIRLGPLGEADADALLRQAAAEDPAILALRQRLLERCEGNPFFLLRCVEALSQRAATGAQPLSAEVLPATVQSLLAARVDALAEDERALLRAAAVVGPVIDLAILGAFLDEPPAQLRERLDGLAARGLVALARLLPVCEYRFQHALIHDAAYAGLTRADRRDLHGRLARILADWPGDLPGRDEAVARHAHAGRLWALAFEAGWRAAMAAKRRSSVAAALSFLTLASEALAALERDGGTPPPRGAVLDLKLEIARFEMPHAGGKERALALLADVEATARAAADHRREALALSIRMTFEWVYVGLGPAERTAAQAIAAARRSGDAAVHFEALARASGLHAESGDVAAADAVDGEGERLIALHGTGCQGDLVLAGPMLMEVGRARAAGNRGQHAEALRRGKQALDLAAALNRQAMDQCYAAAQLGIIASRAGDFAACEAAMEICLRYGELAEAVILRPMALAGLGLARVMRGDPEGWAQIEGALAQATARGHLMTLCQVSLWAAQGRAALGDAAGADGLARTARAHALSIGAAPIAAEAGRWLMPVAAQ